nr:hypothetical protein [Tanacetum cinerariifolium]
MPYRLEVRTSVLDDQDLLVGIIVAEAILLAVLLGGMLAIQHVLTRRYWRPFYRTLAALLRYRNGGPSRRSAHPPRAASRATRKRSANAGNGPSVKPARVGQPLADGHLAIQRREYRPAPGAARRPALRPPAAPARPPTRQRGPRAAHRPPNLRNQWFFAELPLRGARPPSAARAH